MEKHIVLIRIICILYLHTILFGLIFIEKLDRKTKSKGDNIISGKWRLCFFVFNWMCYFFIGKIKEKRKIQFMERRILIYESIKESWSFFGNDALTTIENYELINMKRYLKINKIINGKNYKKQKRNKYISIHTDI